MTMTHPIRSRDECNRIKQYFLQKDEIRNYVLVTIGLNTTLRIHEILDLQWRDVYSFKEETFYERLAVIERKSGKPEFMLLNETVRESLKLLFDITKHPYPNAYVFQSRSGNGPISRVQAYRIIKNAAAELGIEGNIACLSLRKTYGYISATEEGIPVDVLMELFHHSDYQVTKKYLDLPSKNVEEEIKGVKI